MYCNQSIFQLTFQLVQRQQGIQTPLRFKCGPATSNMISSSQFTADLVTFTKEIINGKLHFLCSDFLVSLILF